MAETINLEYILFYSSIPFLVFAFIGNVFVIRIVHKKREMHTPINYLLVNMAVSDAITVLLWSTYFFEFERFICKFVVFIEISIMVSSITLIVLAVERYHVLLKPFRPGLRLNEDNIKKAIALIWTASIVTCFPEFVLKEWSEAHYTCIGPWTLHMNQASKVYVIIIAVISNVELIVMSCCYGSLIRGLYFSNTVYPETERETSAEKKKLVLTFILATTGFLIVHIPTVILYTLIPSGDDEEIDLMLYPDISYVFDFLFVCSLCFNPMIYAFRSANFQEGFKQILLCRKPTSQNEIEVT